MPRAPALLLALLSLTASASSETAPNQARVGSAQSDWLNAGEEFSNNQASTCAERPIQKRDARDAINTFVQEPGPPGSRE
jgi:hypothetical protein